MKTFKFSVIALFCSVLVISMFFLVGYTNYTGRSMKSRITALKFNVDQFPQELFNSSQDPLVDKAYALCLEKAFNKVQVLLSEHNDKLNSIPTLQFIEGICHFRKNNLEMAEKVFLQIVAEGYPLLQDQANWCLAVMKIQQEKIQDAQPYLEVLAGQPNADHHIEACTLMTELGLSIGIAAL